MSASLYRLPSCSRNTCATTQTRKCSHDVPGRGSMFFPFFFFFFLFFFPFLSFYFSKKDAQRRLVDCRLIFSKPHVFVFAIWYLMVACLCVFTTRPGQHDIRQEDCHPTWAPVSSNLHKIKSKTWSSLMER